MTLLIDKMMPSLNGLESRTLHTALDIWPAAFLVLVSPKGLLIEFHDDREDCITQRST